MKRNGERFVYAGPPNVNIAFTLLGNNARQSFGGSSMDSISRRAFVAGLAGAGATGLGWTLFGCTLSPAWDEREFELGDRDALSRRFPEHGAVIRALTR